MKNQMKGRDGDEVKGNHVCGGTTPDAQVDEGTLGYLDPKYLLTSQLNEKSDIYSSGVVLLELITGKKPVEFHSLEQKNLSTYFAPSMEEGSLLEILDKRVLNQKNVDQLKEVALLARSTSAGYDGGYGNVRANTFAAAYDRIQKQMAFEIADGR
ncbi:hypothetical protein K1719_005980 [Acacia pycnantha]|nr:hypothetical protein K1719_005980 [Acacia pycnantha]